MCVGNRIENDMFESMIESILIHGAEIWGWKGKEEVEKVQEKYLKGWPGVDRESPGYTVREEYNRNRMRKRERERQSLRTKWMEGKREKKRTRRSRRKRNTTRGKGIPVKKRKDWKQKEDR
jgi:hypothetical protein